MCADSGCCTVPAGVKAAVPFVPTGVYGFGAVKAFTPAPASAGVVAKVCGAPVNTCAGTVPKAPVNVGGVKGIVAFE